MERNLFYEQLQKESEPVKVHDLVNGIMKDGDRWVSLYIDPDGGVHINVYPWTTEEE